MTVLRSREIVAPKTTPNSSKPRLKADSPSTPAQTHNTSPNTLQSPPDASTPSPQPQYQNPYPNFGSNPKRGCVELTSDSVAVSGGVVRRRSLRLASKCPDSAEGSDKKISAEKSGKMSSAARDDDTCAMAEETVVIGGIGGEDEDRVSNCEVGFDLFGKRGTVKADEGLSELGMNCDLGSSEANYSGEGKNKRKLEIDINFPASNCEGEDGGSEGFLSLRLRKKVAKRGVDGGSNEGLVIYLDADENGSVKSKGGLGSVDGGRNEGLVICLDADDNGGVKSKGGLGSAEKGKEKLGERTFVINDGSDIVVLDSEDELDDDHIESSSRKVSGVMEGAVENINDGVIARDNGISRGEDGFVFNDVDVVEIADEDVNPSNSSCGKRKLSDAIEGEAEGLKDDVISSGNDTDKVRRRFSSSEKGKGILVGEPVSAVGNVDTELVLSSVSNVVPSPVQIQEIVALHNEGHVTSSNTRENVALQNERVAHNSNARENVAFPNEGQVYNSNARENAPDGSRYMDRFREIARRNASRFARFNPEEDEGINVAPPVEVAQDMEDWPGPFSTAMKIIKDRAAKGAQVPSKDNSKPRVTWVPRTEARPFSKNLIPTLQDLCLSVLVKNSDAIASLEHVADCLRHRLCQMLSDSRRMNRHFFELLIQGLPTEVRIRDCSWMTDEQFTESFKLCDPSHLTVLQLDQCGRCMPDYVVHSTLARSSKCLPALITLSLRGACRLSDVGLSAILSSAPELRSLNLSQCSLLSSSSLNTLAGSLGSVLKELYLNDCQGMDAMLILPSLKRLEQLEVLSVAGVETVCDDFIREFSTACGHRLKELVLTDCGKLTDSSMKVIAETCSGLCALDLVNLHKLTDSGLGYLSNGCSAMETLKFCRNSFSDEAIAAFLETSGECLKELSLNNITKVGHNTAISLAKRSRNLHTLDLSWCRDLTDETLGLIVDSCLSLRILKLFGCTQITNVFLHGHSNPEVRIIGLKFSPVLEQVKVPDANSGPLRYSPVF